MRISKLQNIWISAKIITITVIISLYPIIWSIFNRCSRSFANMYLHKWADSLLRIVRVQCKVINPHNVTFSPQQSYVIMSNHRSHFDIPLIFAAFPEGSIRMLAKKELFRVPLFGQAMKKSEFLSIDRKSSQQAQQDLKTAREKMLSGVVLWMAPEGTRSLDGRLQRFKKGGFLLALETQATIVPVAICGSEKILPAKKLNFSLGESVTVRVGEPVLTSMYSVKNIRQLVKVVEERINDMIIEEEKACSL